MQELIDVSAVAAFHDQSLSTPGWPHSSPRESSRSSDVWQWIEANHRYNTLLWNEEDKARRTDVSPAEIAACKRLIDQYNQKRNDAIEAIDETLLTELENYPHAEDARLNSETAGAMIDRLSILALKIFHMREQTQRVDASEEHIALCAAKLERLTVQRHDLASCLSRLFDDIHDGRAYFKVYRQFKMYNDPTLNPYLYAKHSQSGAEKAAS